VLDEKHSIHEPFWRKRKASSLFGLLQEEHGGREIRLGLKGKGKEGNCVAGGGRPFQW